MVCLDFGRVAMVTVISGPSSFPPVSPHVADELVDMQTKFVRSGSADKLCLHRKS